MNRVGKLVTSLASGAVLTATMIVGGAGASSAAPPGQGIACPYGSNPSGWTDAVTKKQFTVNVQSVNYVTQLRFSPSRRCAWARVSYTRTGSGTGEQNPDLWADQRRGNTYWNQLGQREVPVGRQVVTYTNAWNDAGYEMAACLWFWRLNVGQCTGWY